MERALIRSAMGFTLVEIMVSVVILALLMFLVFSGVTATGRMLRASTERTEGFQDGRAAFDRMTRRISQATLNVYYDYFDDSGKPSSDSSYSGSPAVYGRQSELQFKVGKALVPGQAGHAVFFVAPEGQAGQAYSDLDELLGACGYFIRFGSDDSKSSLSGRPDFPGLKNVPLRCRYRLMELSQPSEQLSIYKSSSDPLGWFKAPLAQSPPLARAIAENVVALVLLPKKPDWQEKQDAAEGVARIGLNYEYDSRTSWSGSGGQPATMNQLPPILKVAMVVIDEDSARRLQGTSTSAPDLGLSGLFQKSASFDADLDAFQRGLRQRNLHFRVFQTEIALRSAAWSQ